MEGTAVSRWRVLWSMRRYEISKLREKFVRWVAWHLPHEVVMWCYMRVAAHAMTGEYSQTNTCDLGMMDAIKRWDTAKK